MLRLLNNKLATDGSLSRFGVQGPSKWFCCHNGMNEDINHLFSYGQIAEKVWNFLCQIFLEVGEETLDCVRAFQADFEEKEHVCSGVQTAWS